jgi:hypothetical protein
VAKPFTVLGIFDNRFTPAEAARLHACTTQAEMTRTYRDILARSPNKLEQLMANHRRIEADIVAAIKRRQRLAA